MPPDYSKFVGIRYRLGGRTFKACDCYGLLILFYREFGVELPDLSVSSFKLVTRAFVEEERNPHWSRIATPSLKDIAVFSKDGLPCHCGIMLDRVSMLHNEDRQSCVERINSPIWESRLYGFYRYSQDA